MERGVESARRQTAVRLAQVARSIADAAVFHSERRPGIAGCSQEAAAPVQFLPADVMKELERQVEWRARVMADVAIDRRGLHQQIGEGNGIPM